MKAALRHGPSGLHRPGRAAADQQAQPGTAVGGPLGEDVEEAGRDRVRGRMGRQDRLGRREEGVRDGLLPGDRQDRAHGPGDLRVPESGLLRGGPYPADEIRRKVGGRGGPGREERLQGGVRGGGLQRLGEEPLMRAELLGGHGTALGEQQPVGPAVGGIDGQTVLGLGRPRRPVGPPARPAPVPDQPVAHGVPEPRQMRRRQLPRPPCHGVDEGARLRPGPAELGPHVLDQRGRGVDGTRVVRGDPVGVGGRHVPSGGGQQGIQRDDHSCDRRTHR